MFIFGRIMFMRSPDPKEAGGTGGDPNPAPAPAPKDPKPSDKSAVELAKALEEARKNSVPREDYEKVVKEKEELVSQIINGEGGYGNGQPTPPKEVDIGALREELYGEQSTKLSNLEYCKKTLELRKAVLEKEGYDPFLPHGANIKPDSNDIEKANNVAEVMEQCIEEADGNSEVFTALLQARINNDSPVLTAHLKKLEALKRQGSVKK